jgi:DNA polymerase I-like protein with 3'-5' exonuclease and polymerase domains
MINEGLKPIAQFHDEVLLCVDEDKAEWAEKTLHKCMENVNNLLGYPIKLEVDVQVGRTYADVH